MDALFEGRSVDFTGPHPIAKASWLAEREAAAKRAAVLEASTEAEAMPQYVDSLAAARARNQRIAGWSLFGVGAASIGASVGLHVRRGNLGDEFRDAPSSLQAADEWWDARVSVWALAGFGGVAATAAMPMLLPDDDRTPWWGWALGAAGLGLTGYAIYEGATMTGCPEPYITDATAVDACVTRGQEAGRVALALAGAVPLLTVPLVYVFRPLRMQPSLSMNRRGATLRLRRSF
jgi:hypothetical protein